MSTTRSQPDRHAIAEHLAALHQCAAGTNGLLVLASFGADPMTDHPLQPLVEHFTIGAVEPMTDRAIEWSVLAHRNVYAPLVVVRPDLAPGKKGDETDIVKVLGLVADFDDPGAPQWASRSPMPPTAILETSPQRFQTFFLFDRPLDVTSAKDLARRLQAHTRCDFGTKDLSHVWRIAGSLNWPNKKKLDAGRASEPCLVVEVPDGSNAAIDPSALAAALPVLPPLVNNGTTFRPAQPVEADDRTQLDRMFQSRHGENIRRLWNGDWHDYPSQSEGDSALTYHLAFWFSRDATRMDRLFRQSALFRDKWDTRRGDSTYGADTIAHACANCRETYTPSRPVMTEKAPAAGRDETPDKSTEKTDTPPPHDPPRTDSAPGLTKELSDSILRTDYFARDAGGQLYIFERGVYRPHGEAAILKRVKSIMEANGDTKRWSSHRAREVVAYIHVDAPLLWEGPKPDVLNLTNGLFSLSTGALTLHTPAHFSSVQLPVTYDPTARCPLWDSFIERVLPDDCRALPYELVAASMRGEVSDQKAVLLVGPGENGKSTLLSAIVAFLGHENVSTLALQRLEVDKFAVVRLLGKLANVCADLPSDHLMSTSTFKALTGGDHMTAERKFQESFELRPFARLLFSANFYPQSKDTSRAFFRRWLVLPFETTIEPQERIDNLADQLADPTELSGILNRALSLLPKMVRQGGFSQNETTRGAAIEFQEMTDPLAVWLDRHTSLTADAMVTRKDLLILYNADSDASGRPPVTSKAFCADVRRLRPTVQEKQRIIHGSMHWVFLGMGVCAPAPTATHDAGHHAPAGLFSEEVVDED